MKHTLKASLWLALLLLVACGDAESPPGGHAGQDASEDMGALLDIPQQDMAGGQPDAEPDAPEEDLSQGPPAPGAYGAACAQDEDCDEGFCVPDGNGGICSSFCLEGCQPFYPDRPAFCRSDPSRGGDVAFLCYPLQDLLCAPCVEDTQCDAGVCLTSLEGGRCSVLCQSDADCTQGARCQTVLEDGQELRACVPANGTCTCNARTEGTVRPCLRLNSYGACDGQEICEPAQGWVGCDAPAAAPEVCNGLDEDCNGVADDGLEAQACAVENELGACPGVAICQGELGELCVGPQASPEVCDGLDNDCDGAIDDPFTDEEGGYTLVEHCGGCNINCQGRIAFAQEVACDASGPEPTCVVVECAPGYQQAGDALCSPMQEVTCQPCSMDAECEALSQGSACLTLGQPGQPQAQVCGRDCSPEGAFGEACPQGFVCQSFGERRQCIPEGGSCLCRDNPEGFALPCVLETPGRPQQTCQGVQRCQPDGSLGACEAPEEVCDGLDNDCDGLIDEGARDEVTGRYDQDPAHCGRCNNDCGQLTFPHAAGACDTQAPVPTCQMVCEEGFVDLFNGSDDGCECVIQPGEDRPDGLDQNCDRVDGDVSRAVFVSKAGRPGAAGTLEDPLDSVQDALERAGASNGQLRDVYVATGVYSENLVMVPGVSLYGGYSFDFLTRDLEANPTTLFGRPPSGQQRGTVTFRACTQEMRLDGFTVYGASAGSPGANSYAIYLEDCDSRAQLSRNRVFAGHGGDGQRGLAGEDGLAGSSGSGGLRGVAANSFVCSLPERGGGRGGQRVCEATNVSGGDGGAAHCPYSQTVSGLVPCDVLEPEDCRNNCDQEPCSPLPPPQGPGMMGQGGDGGQGGAPTYDRWSDSGTCFICGLNPGLRHRGDLGLDGGDGSTGEAGLGCGGAQGSMDAQGQWRAASGTPGSTGLHGSGGGGGSAGSGFDIANNTIGDVRTCFDRIGGSGGGGGSGGCAGSGGTGGSSGGASFAVVIHYTRGGFATLPVVVDNEITTGDGGDGGPGGSAGVGGLGGSGADGGTASSDEALCSEPGGRGGNGGNGGSGGGGGGGCGGPSVGIYLNRGGNDLNVATLRGDNLFSEQGQPGRGGPGGGAPQAPGQDGVQGVSGQVLQR